MAISVPSWPATFSIAPDPASVGAHGTLQFTSLGDDLANIYSYYAVWTSSDTTIATVNSGFYEEFWHYHLSNSGLAAGVTPGVVTITATLTADELPLTGAPPGGVLTATAELTVTTAPGFDTPEGRFLVAFGDTTLNPAPTWTRLDDQPNLVTSYTIDRGRAYELDRMDTGRATVQIIDPDGVLDPTNPDGPYYGQLQPLIQATIGRHNPVTDTWTTRYRGFVEDYTYTIDPSQQLNRLTISLVDLCELLTAAEMHTGEFGHASSAASHGQVLYNSQGVAGRINDILRDYGLPAAFKAILPPADPVNHTYLQETIYSPGESVLSGIQEAADGEFPALATVFCDRHGRLVYRDRLAKFFPLERSADVGADVWDYHEWKAGDGTAVALSIADTVQVRELGFQRGLSKIINSASATPMGIADEDINGQLVADPTSINPPGGFGIRSWSADGLLTAGSAFDVYDNLAETRRFATYYVENYKTPRDRITSIGFRPLHPDDERAPALYEFLGTVDISDSITVTVAAAGGGGFDTAEYFVEGIHEEARPLDPDYDDVTVRLDLSPRAYYSTNPWLDA